MIGWYADYGYVEGMTLDGDISSLNQVTFTDFHRPFCIPVKNPDFTLPPKDTIIIQEEDAQTFYEKLQTVFGNDVNTMYATISASMEHTSQQWLGFKEGYDKLTYAIPSVSYAAPNLFSKVLDLMENRHTNSYVRAVIKIPSLERVILCAPMGGGTYDGHTSVYRLKDGNIEMLVNISLDQIDPIYISMRNSYSLNFKFLLEYVPGQTDIADVKNYPQNHFYIVPYYARDVFRYYRLVSGFSESNLTQLQNFLTALFGSNQTPDFENNVPPDNPYEPGGPSGPGGGDGSFDNDSDQIIDSSLPTISSANTGFTRIYNPSLSQVQALARYLWTDESVIQTIWNHIKQYFEDPMQAIIGFNLVPVPVPNGGTQSFALMYIDTGVEMTVAASQFVDVDCGTFELKEYYGSALDYSPNTKVSCFLPFIGTVSLNTDEVMGRTLQVKYRVDICSGSCVAKIGVDSNFIYQYSGHCAINIPISSADFSSYVSSAISVAQLAGGAIAAGAGGVMASAAVDASQQTNQVVTTTQITNTARNPATGRQITTGTMTRVETRESPNDQSSTQASFSGLTPQNISNTVGQIMSSKPNINHSGSFSGNSGYLGVRRPFLIIERPNMCMPSNFQTLNGFPSMITLELSSCKGFTRVQQVQLTGFYATNPEQAEILQLLKSGVIL